MVVSGFRRKKMRPFEKAFDRKALKKAFDEDGFVHIKHFFDKRLCEEAIKTIVNHEISIGESNSKEAVTETIDGRVLTKYYQGAYGLGTALRKFFSLQLMLVGSALLDSDEIYFSDLEAHIRNPGGGEIPKHQDNFYFNLKSAKGLTCYIALNAHDENSGGLNYIRGSHERVIEHSGSLCAGFSSEIRDETQEFQEKKSLDIYTPNYSTGDITLHHANNIHFSKPVEDNLERRFALSARIFEATEDIDESGRQRYLRLLQKNRSFK